MSELLKLQPERVWYYFNEICKIPRPSKKEEKIAGWLVEFGKKNNLETLKDSAGNVLIRKPATRGKENNKAVVLQSHIDMVCEKNASTVHDFDRDPIQPVKDGDWVKAKGTTLGADDGIGMAAQLAILEASGIAHGPLECLFTVDEETGLTGAFALQPGFVKGKVLLNLDSEDEGQLFIGCAGGKDTSVTFSFKKENVPARMLPYKISVTGLKGGHSGDDINKGLGNAVKIMNRFLMNASENYAVRISKIEGGNLRNAIAREAFAYLVVPADKKDNLIKYACTYNDIIKNEFHVTEPDLKFVIEDSEIPAFVIDPDTQFRLLHSLYACPHGVIAMTADMPGLVETSTNLASVKTEDNKIFIQTSQRSSVETSKDDIARMVASAFKLAGAEVKHGEGYPGWKPDLNSEILSVMKDSYKKLFAKDPLVLAIHAGLECGVIGEKYPGMDMISFGPTLRGVHSPDERIHIESVGMFWKLLIEVLKTI
ncbi:MAG: aminoacyl-histidine dipeptidase [Bacteroidota bacterium]